MPARVEIKGTSEFRVVAARLKAAGDGKLTRQMGKRMKTAAQPAVRAAQQAVKGLAVKGVRGGGGQQRRTGALAKRQTITERAQRAAFRNRGLRSHVARATRMIMKTSGWSAGVTIRARRSLMPTDQRKLPHYLNKGRWRHPVFGRRGRWVGQTAPPGWFDQPMREHGPRIRDKAVEVVSEINREIAR